MEVATCDRNDAIRIMVQRLLTGNKVNCRKQGDFTHSRNWSDLGSKSVMGILRRLSVRPVFKIPKPAGFFSDVLTFENELGCE